MTELLLPTSAGELAHSGATELSVPRLGFLGVGWIGRHRMEAIANAGLCEVAAIADSSTEMLAAAR
ncbi:MAG TPA: hypothetical protein VJT67_12210, partial [Longimicrobiaceae bacterium]|nr:hypothetical protein [Longimicrobiaceae bacterium]